MAVNFRLAYNSGLEIVDLFPASSMDAIIDNSNVMQYSTINVTIPAPASQTMTQTIAITTTQSQLNSPVYMLLTSTGTQAIVDYATINQFQVSTNQLIITRLYNWPEDSINVILIFEEAGV